MRGYLLDTHVLLWAAVGSPRLPAEQMVLLTVDRKVLRYGEHVRKA
ncbi:type II toxin-antitoxin system VapC family toxin [Georgenia yuyongxinii]|uniref:Type II toxin-antitoxin system VapC family toxin n=1 Tax=Georgenia yuyongxinii TaxID=2589797 RepID=A0A5B8C7J6_9MICO|nr:type II toxin-antitoxin system VapC family toxin [Georgenia yuyongxinii]QDC25142.1 type II toxin-antitoxin system VapC family toxin [Georgenia yuyongxinii]